MRLLMRFLGSPLLRRWTQNGQFQLALWQTVLLRGDFRMGWTADAEYRVLPIAMVAHFFPRKWPRALLWLHFPVNTM